METSRYVDGLKKAYKGKLGREEIRSLLIRARMGEVEARNRLLNFYYPTIIAMCVRRRKKDDRASLDVMISSCVDRVLECFVKIRPIDVDDPRSAVFSYVIRTIQTALHVETVPGSIQSKTISTDAFHEHDQEGTLPPKFRLALFSATSHSVFPVMQIEADSSNGVADDVLNTQILASCFKELPLQYRTVLARWMGLFGEDAVSLEEIGVSMGFSTSKAYNVKRAAICELKRLCQERLNEIVTEGKLSPLSRNL